MWIRMFQKSSDSEVRIKISQQKCSENGSQTINLLKRYPYHFANHFDR